MRTRAGGDADSAPAAAAPPPRGVTASCHISSQPEFVPTSSRGPSPPPLSHPLPRRPPLPGTITAERAVSPYRSSASAAAGSAEPSSLRSATLSRRYSNSSGADHSPTTRYTSAAAAGASALAAAAAAVAGASTSLSSATADAAPLDRSTDNSDTPPDDDDTATQPADAAGNDSSARPPPPLRGRHTSGGGGSSVGVGARSGTHRTSSSVTCSGGHAMGGAMTLMMQATSASGAAGVWTCECGGLCAGGTNSEGRERVGLGGFVTQPALQVWAPHAPHLYHA
eukprot:351150-Chlamydomonas_euryale.AAC.1